MDARSAQYWHALRWYPAEWRRQHGAALVGDLMDQDDARGRVHLSKSDRGALLVAGLRTRLATRGQPSSPQWLLRSVGAIGALGLCVWYAVVTPVTFAPAGSGFFGPTDPPGLLSNGSFAPAALLLCCIVATLAMRETLARALGGAAAVTALVATQLASGRLIGPDMPTGAILIVFGLMSAVPTKRWSVAVAFLVACVALALYELARWGGSPVAFAAANLLLSATGVFALTTVVRSRRRRSGSVS